MSRKGFGECIQFENYSRQWLGFRVCCQAGGLSLNCVAPIGSAKIFRENLSSVVKLQAAVLLIRLNAGMSIHIKIKN